MPKILIDLKARKRYSQLPNQDKERIARAINSLESDGGRILNIRRLRLPKGKFFRVRVGNIRIIYECIRTDTIYISVIDYRGNVY